MEEKLGKKAKLSNKMKGGLVAGALALGVLGGAFSYYSGTAETKVNTFNIVAGQENQDNAGTITEITEPSWKKICSQDRL